MIIAYMQTHWVEWVFAAALALLGFIQSRAAKQLAEEKRKNNALMLGVQSLLRESIVANYNKYQDREYCPIYAKESVKKVYEAYHNLGGNDVATKLYHTLLDMPEEPREEGDRK